MKTPTQAALIQFLQSLIISALVTALIAIGPLLMATGPVDWKQIGLVAGVAFILSILHGVAEYLKQYNPQLSSAVETDLTAVEARVNVAPTPPLQGEVVSK